MNVSALEALVWEKLDDPTGVYYPAANVLAALNEAERYFALLTLCLEVTVTFSLSASTPLYSMLGTYVDWIMVRRVFNSQGKRMRPARLSDLDALDANWLAVPGTPTRYAALGLDLLAVYPQPSGTDSLTIIYAQAPAALVNPSDVPAIPASCHYALANYAAYALRQTEGGSEFQKFTGLFNDFLDEAQKLQALIKTKNLDARYEKPPYELARMDRSRLGGQR